MRGCGVVIGACDMAGQGRVEAALCGPCKMKMFPCLAVVSCLPVVPLFVGGG